MLDNEKLSEETTKVDAEVENKEALDNGVSENSDANKENVNDVEFTDTKKTEETPAGKVAEDESKNETKTQDNSENARRRREAERKQELKRTRYDAIKEAVDGVNPFTNKPIVDDLDVEEYLTMKEIKKQGGDPLADFSQFSKDKQKKADAEAAKVEAEAEAARKKQEEQEEWIEKDFNDFKSKHPEVNLDELGNDEAFELYAKALVGKKTMSEIYEGYQEIVSRAKQEQNNVQARQVANAKATPGSLTSPETDEGDFFTIEQVKKMSQAEVSKNYDKIMKSMPKWKY